MSVISIVDTFSKIIFCHFGHRKNIKNVQIGNYKNDYSEKNVLKYTFCLFSQPQFNTKHYEFI